MSKHQIQPEHVCMEMSRLTRGGTVNPFRETKLSGTYRDRGIIIFPVQLTTSRIGNLTRLIHSLLSAIQYVMTYIPTQKTSKGRKR